MLASQVAVAMDHPVGALVVGLKDSGTRQRLRLTTLEPLLELPNGSPELTGGSVEVLNPLSGEQASLPMPPGEGWGRNADGTSEWYNGRSRTTESPPVKLLRMKAGKRLKLVTRATGITLDEDSQGSVAVVITVGEDRYCAVCDLPTRDQVGTFVATRCPAPAACPGAQTDSTAPSIPAGASASAVSCSQVNLSWSASSDPGGSGVAAYRVYRNSAFLQQVGAPGTSTSDTAVAASTVYGYQVSALDNAGNESARSVTASTNTPACPTGGTHLWSKRMGGTVLADAVVPRGVAVDGSGNAVVTGSFYGAVTFGSGTVTSAGRADLFVAKYSSAGVLQWVQRFGDDADQFGTAVATDTAGNVYVTGYFFGTVSFGGTALTSVGYDVVLAKYTAGGAHVWSKRLGGTSYEMGQALAVDSGGNVLVAGQFAATVDFGGGPLTSAGSYDGFVAKYTTNGAHVWSRRMGGTGLDTVTGLGVDAQGNPTMAGYFAGTASFGGANLTSAGGNDVFVARYTAAGAHQWSTRFGDVDDQRAYAAAVDGTGNVVLTGFFGGTVGFGGTALASTGGADIFLAKLTASGTHAWSKGFGTDLSYGEVGEAVAVDGAGNVLLTGEIIRDVDFGGGALVAPATYDAFVAKFNAAGTHQWSKRFAANWDDHGNAVAVDGSGNVLLTGDFYEAVSFGGSLLSSPGGSDGFLAKLGP